MRANAIPDDKKYATARTPRTIATVAMVDIDA
jgi:hypothetical protein